MKFQPLTVNLGSVKIGNAETDKIGLVVSPNQAYRTEDGNKYCVPVNATKLVDEEEVSECATLST